ncbi:MAG: N-acetylmuramoyl-L-alanine amidase [Nitrospirae bacterium]|nr:N-acetylmuramoyl-L-alanine amidase [Nitrospirota bacterium]
MNVVVGNAGNTRYATQTLSNPERLFIDIKGGQLSPSIKSAYPASNGLLNRIRVARHDAETVRIVFDLSAKAAYAVSASGGNLSIKITPETVNETASVIAPAVEQPIRQDAIPAPAPKAAVSPEQKHPFTVVIDAGHGGKDPGATSRKGLREKDLTLDIALRLRDELTRQGIARVVLTRDTDVFIPLGERAEIANRENADLFLSVHVNAARNRRIKGLETWFMNATNNKEWQEVADRENAAAGTDPAGLSTLDAILSDLNRCYKIDESMSLAHHLQSSMIASLQKNHAGIQDHGVKWAKFRVLVGARMPAALIETGFISNSENEAELRKPQYRTDVARSVSAAISNYLNTSKTTRLSAAQTRDTASAN